MNHKILSAIELKLKRREEISPFLFLGNDGVKNNLQTKQFINQLFEKFGVSKYCLYEIPDNGEQIKIAQAKLFMENAFQKPSGLFQIFYIENISRFTVSASNSLLKFLEEPGIGNIVFLTNSGENNILDTILSRVQKIYFQAGINERKSDFYYHQIHKMISSHDNSLINYFFKEQLEKEEYILFLRTMIAYSRDHHVFIDIIDQIEATIGYIQNNNVLPKYQIDKILAQIYS